MKGFAVVLLMLFAMPAMSVPWLGWPTVGTAQLTWGFWTLYDSELRTPAGQYQAGSDLALLIRYRRNIDNEDLVEATDEQWQHLGIGSLQRQQWLGQLTQLWPDVAKGDSLGFVMRQGAGQFYFNGQQLGEPMQGDFSQAFIDIWLDANTSYPDLRSGLLGKGQ